MRNLASLSLVQALLQWENAKAAVLTRRVHAKMAQLHQLGDALPVLRRDRNVKAGL